MPRGQKPKVYPTELVDRVSALYSSNATQKSLPWDRVWPNEDSPLGMGVDDGLPERLDRLSRLGNAVVPQIPEIIGRAIMRASTVTSHNSQTQVE